MRKDGERKTERVEGERRGEKEKGKNKGVPGLLEASHPLGENTAN